MNRLKNTAFVLTTTSFFIFLVTVYAAGKVYRSLRYTSGKES